jgi:DNA-binding NtrC family response regulator
MGPDGESSGAEDWHLGRLAQSPEPPVGTRVSGGGYGILVVEDDPDVAELAANALELMGYRVAVSCNAAAALHQLSADKRGFDLVFSDIVMPGGMSGIDLALTLRARFPALPVLLATGYSNAALSPAAQQFRVLAKPYRLQELGQVVAELLATGATAR